MNVLVDSGASRLYIYVIIHSGLGGTLDNYQFNQAVALPLGHRVQDEYTGKEVNDVDFPKQVDIPEADWCFLDAMVRHAFKGGGSA